MALAGSKVFVSGELVVRESDAAALVLVTIHAGDKDRPLSLHVMEKLEDHA